MVVIVKERIEKTRSVKNNDKFFKFILRGERNMRYHAKLGKNNKISFYKNSTGQQSNLLFLANPSEHSM